MTEKRMVIESFPTHSTPAHEVGIRVREELWKAEVAAVTRDRDNWREAAQGKDVLILSLRQERDAVRAQADKAQQDFAAMQQIVAQWHDTHHDLARRRDRLLLALRGLLQDTQHRDHRCGDEDCPVAFARTVAEEEAGK